MIYKIDSKYLIEFSINYFLDIDQSNVHFNFLTHKEETSEIILGLVPVDGIINFAFALEKGSKYNLEFNNASENKLINALRGVNNIKHYSFNKVSERTGLIYIHYEHKTKGKINS